MKKFQSTIWILTGLLCLSLTACHKEPLLSVTKPVEGEIAAASAVPETISETEPQATAPETEDAAAIAPVTPEEDALVLVTDFIPQILVELKYAGEENFTGQPIYEFQDVYLRYGTVKKLMAVQESLEAAGLGLKIWDGFRPVAAQFKLWEVCPDPTYVADPRKGYSNHSRGSAVDLTLVDSTGAELEMPTAFDDFSAMADRDYTDCSQSAARNAAYLEDLMEKNGFTGYFGEWWHFSDSQSYPVEERFQPTERAWYYADCQEYITLRREPDTAAEELLRIPAGEEFQVLGIFDDFAMIRYSQTCGYVLRDYIQPKQ